MGTTTTNFGLYKPDSTELVNVDLDLNNNLDICDEQWKKLFEYHYYNNSLSPAANTAEVIKQGYKYYSAQTGAALFIGSDGGDWEDVNATVGRWFDFTPNLNGVYAPFGAAGTADHATYKVYNNATGGHDVKFAGKIGLASGAELPLNSAVSVGTLLPNLVPVVDKGFLCYAGNSASYSIARVGINATTGVLSFIRVGANTVDATQRWISLDGIRYSTDVAA